MSIKILLNGAKGRMGNAIINVSPEMGCEVVAKCDVGDNPADFLNGCDVAVDFSLHDSTPALAEACAQHEKPLVIGTTGHDEAQKARIYKAAESIPMVWAGNYSVGVNVLLQLTRTAARLLDESYHPEIVEMHHRHKKDAPSGTAENLLDAVLEGRNWNRDTVAHGRSGITGERPDQQVGVHALRGGDVVGEHSVLFAGPGEKIVLQHSAADRSIFARGALVAAKWVASAKTPGVYRMEDVLFPANPAT